MLLTIVIALVILVVLIVFKVNAFLAFLISAITAGLLSGMEIGTIINAIETGLGNTLGSLTIILGFGAVIGKIMAVSGAARQIAHKLVNVFGQRYLKWAMALIGFLIGIPMFFAIGFVILVPLMFSVASKAKVSFIYLGIPLVAAMSVTHGLLPPHPAPAAIAQQFGSPMGEVILWGMLLAVPTIILSGPIFASLLKNIKSEPLKIFLDNESGDRLPGIGISIFCALLPIFLMMLDTLIGGFIESDSILYQFVVFLSQPLTSMLIATIVILYLLEIRRGTKLKAAMKLMEEAISGIAMILLIIGGAGALNEVFKVAGLNEYLAGALKGIQISPIVLCWGIAALIRVALGSATVAAMTTAGILAPIYVAGTVNPVLLVLATGSGSIIFSHVNDGGFWLFKEYFNLSIKETLLSWSMMETIIAVCGLAGCLILNMFI
jgi:Gnt-I system high-affinity gluconate transporter